MANKRIELTTRYGNATCVVTAYGVTSNGQRGYHLMDSAVRRAERRLVVGNDCLMLTPSAAKIVGDEITVAADGSSCPLYATLTVKRS